METRVAGIAFRSPTAFGHFGLAAGIRPCADLQAFPLPNGIMPVTRPDQGVGNFVQDRVENFIWSIPLDQMDRQFNGLAVIQAQPQRSLAAVEAERPAV